MEVGVKWKLLKYSDGHFIEHCDYNRPAEPHIHYGTQIWLPSKAACNYKGGVLITKDKLRNEIIPDETNWTFIIMPLGVLHEVTQVEG